MIDTKKTGERIAILRKERGLTAEKFSEILNVSPQVVSKWYLRWALYCLTILLI